MDQSINISVSDRTYYSSGYLVGAQSDQVHRLATGSATIKFQKELALPDPEGSQSQSLKSCLQKSQCLFTPLANCGLKGRAITVFFKAGPLK